MPALDPAVLRICSYPAPVLRRKAAPIGEVTQEHRDVAERMIALMRQAEGIGLAAPQVGLSWRMFVCHVPESEPEGRRAGRSADAVPPTANRAPEIFINPVLSDYLGAPEKYEEGCLSLPEIRGDVLRPPIVSITASDLEGRRFTRTGAGLLARCWQHEIDHLDGVLIIDRMTQMSRLKVRRALRELEEGE